MPRTRPRPAAEAPPAPVAPALRPGLSLQRCPGPVRGALGTPAGGGDPAEPDGEGQQARPCPAALPARLGCPRDRAPVSRLPAWPRLTGRKPPRAVRPGLVATAHHTAPCALQSPPPRSLQVWRCHGESRSPWKLNKGSTEKQTPVLRSFPGPAWSLPTAQGGPGLHACAWCTGRGSLWWTRTMVLGVQGRAFPTTRAPCWGVWHPWPWQRLSRLQGQGRSSCDQRTLGPQRGPPGPGVGTLWDGPGGQYWALGPVFLVEAAARAPQTSYRVQSAVARGRARMAPQLLSLTPIPSPVLLPPRHPLPPLVFGCLPLLPRPPPPAPAAWPPGSLPSPAKGRGALGGPGVVGRMGRSQDRAEDLVGSTWGPGLLPHPVRVACDSTRLALGTAFARRNVHPSALLPEPWTRTGHPPVWRWPTAQYSQGSTGHCGSCCPRVLGPGDHELLGRISSHVPRSLLHPTGLTLCLS